MADKKYSPAEVLSSPEYASANKATKQEIFNQLVASDPEFQNANQATKNVIMDRWGVSVPAEEVAEPTMAEVMSKEAKPEAPKTDAQKKQDLLDEYNAQRTQGQLYYGGAGAGAGAGVGVASKFFPKPELPVGPDVGKAATNLAEIQASRAVEAADLASKLKSSGLNVSNLDDARALQSITPTLEAELAKAEKAATSYGSSVKPTINVPPVSSLPDIVDVVQHSATSGLSPSSLARETGQHELAHARSQAGQAAKQTAERVAKQSGTSYANVLTKGEGHAPTPSGRLLVPQTVALQLEQEALQALDSLSPMRQAAEAEIRRLKSLNQDTSALVSRLNNLRKQETVAMQLLEQAKNVAPGKFTKAGVASGKVPIASNVLGGALAGLSIQDLNEALEAGTPLDVILAGINAAFGAASMVPPVGPGAVVRGVGTIGSLGMIPVNIAAEVAKRKGMLPRAGSVMDKRRAGTSPELTEK
jgi:hypothetical protein